MTSNVSEEELIRFDEFELALKSRELRKNGNVVRLQPQPFKVLAFLAAHAGETITRQELQQAVWEGDTFVDFEHGLNFCIKQIRSALGDDAQSPRLIETLPRRGYRFIAAVKRPGDSPVFEPYSGGKGLPAALRPARASFAKRLVLPAAIAAMVIATAYVAWRTFNKPPAPLSRIMIAVLPFENLSGDIEQDYFSDGMTEEMIARLGRLEPDSLGVIARTSAMTYKHTNKDISNIGRELGVDFVIEGSVRREQDKVRITAQLIKVSDQTHLWSESYDRATGDALRVQSEVADQIATALTIRLLGERKTGLLHSENAEAVDAYLRGRYLWNRADRESVGRSIGNFEQAIEKDQRYAAAYTGLADSYRLLGMYYVMLPADAYPKAREAALRALELDPTSADALVSLGSIKFRYEWAWEEADRDFLRAIEINPSLAIAHHDYAWFLVAMGRFDEGIDHMKLAQRLDPLSPLANSDVGWVYLMARRYDEAIEQIKRTLELEPRFGSALACLERAYTLKGQHREALETLLREAGASLQNGDPEQMVKSLHRKRLERKLAAMMTSTSSPYGVATICIEAGERDQAVEWLERAFKERDPMLVSVRSDPVFDPLRSDARFGRLLRQIGFSE